jgi:site-specific recombinase XerD
MRQVISRFLKHLEAEKNASATTIETYQYDLHKFNVYLVKRLGKRFWPLPPGNFIRDFTY